MRQPQRSTLPGETFEGPVLGAFEERQTRTQRGSALQKPPANSRKTTDHDGDLAQNVQTFLDGEFFCFVE
jgi:hypothetical protein